MSASIFYKNKTHRFCGVKRSSFNGGFGMSSSVYRGLRNAAYAMAIAVATQVSLVAAQPAELTVADGVVVKFGTDAQMVVRDKIVAGQAVVLTSVKDDALGGQVGAQQQTATAGDWLGLRIEKSTAVYPTITLTDWLIRYAGANNEAALTLRGVNPALQALQLTDSSTGLRLLAGAAPTISTSNFQRNTTGLEAKENSAPTISGSQFAANTTWAISNITPSTVLQALGNWWGHISGPTATSNPAGQGQAVSNGVDIGSFLAAEPLLNPVVRLTNPTAFSDRSAVQLSLACVNATEYRIAENNFFAGAEFSPLTNSMKTVMFDVSAGDGTKAIGVQFRNATGTITTATLAGGVLIDTQPPELDITYPDVDELVITSPITLTATATDTSGITSVDFYVNEELKGSDSTLPYSYDWANGGSADGTYTIKVVARDSVGRSTEQTRTVTLSRSAPAAVSLNSDPNLQELDGASVKLQWSYNEQGVDGGSGDVLRYDIYQSASPFSSAALMPKATIPGATKIASINAAQPNAAGQVNREYTVSNLARGVPQYFGVVVLANRDIQSAVTAIALTPVDKQAPANPSAVMLSSIENNAATVGWAASNSADVSSYKIYVGSPSTSVAANVCANKAAITSACSSTPYSNCQLSTTELSKALTLTAASNTPVCVAAVDGDHNESAGVDKAVVTLLGNPAVSALQAEDIGDKQIKLTWAAGTPNTLVKQYRLYAETSDFNSVSGLTPKRIVTGSNVTSAVVTGLSNGVTYYFAVVAENGSGAYSPAVTTVSGTPLADNVAPVISTPQFRQTGGVSTTTVSLPGTLSQDGFFRVTVSDLPAGKVTSKVDHVDFYVNNNLIGTSSKSVGSNVYEVPWAVTAQTQDSVHSFSVKAYDSFNNEAVLAAKDVTVALGVPSPPTVSSPLTGATVVESSVQVIGKVLEKNTEVVIRNAETSVDTLVRPNSAGDFTVDVPLQTGASNVVNNLSVKARYINAGATTFSGQTNIAVNYDPTQPAPPTGLSATAMADGFIAVKWQRVIEPGIKGYKIYASKTDTPPASLDGGISVAASVTEYRFKPASAEDRDGDRWYFWVTALDSATPSRSSELSSVVSAIADDVAPQLVSFVITPQADANVSNDSAPPTYGIGDYQLSLTFTEELSSRPFLSWTTAGSMLKTVELYQDPQNPKHWRGLMTIASTPAVQNKVVSFNLSAYDKAGNVGPDTTESMELLVNRFSVDNQGPIISSIVIDQRMPVQIPSVAGVYQPVALSLEVTFDEAPVTPVLKAKAGTAEEQLIALTPVPGSTHKYNGSFVVPANAMADPTETTLTESAELRFSHHSVDALGNASNVVNGNSVVQLYKGVLPSLDAPSWLTATAQPAGVIRLAWPVVNDAGGYRLYRGQKVGTANTITWDEESLAGDINALTYDDLPDVDGEYYYKVASLRVADGQIVESLFSQETRAVSDSVLPATPCALEDATAEYIAAQKLKKGAGVLLRWNQTCGTPISADVKYYQLLGRESTCSGANDIEGMQLLIDRIAVDNSAGRGQLALDSKPGTANCYSVVAVDGVGNVSLAADTLQVQLPTLPVNSVRAVLTQGQKPALSWAHANLATHTFSVQRAGQAAPEDVTSCNSTSCNYQDGSDNGIVADRVYDIIATPPVASGGLPAVTELVVPGLEIELVGSQAGVPDLYRGTMNQLQFRVRNHGAQVITGARLSVTVAGYPNQNATNCSATKTFNSGLINLSPGAEDMVPVVIGGDWLGNNAGCVQTPSASLTVKLDYSAPLSGQTVQYVSTVPVLVGDKAVLMTVAGDQFVRGAAGKVYITVDNNGPVDLEFVTSPKSNPSTLDDVRLVLEDSAGHILASQTLEKLSGEGILSGIGQNKHSVVRIAAGTRFTSGPFDFNLPVNLPDDATLRVNIGQFYHHLGQEDQVNIAGTTGSAAVNLADLPYGGELLPTDPITPAAVFGQDTPVLIRGRAVLPTGSSLQRSGLPLLLVLNLRGVEKQIPVTTDAEGNFSYSFTSKGESGTYTVAVVHPDSTGRATAGSFEVNNAYVVQTLINLVGPTGYNQPLTVDVKAGSNTELSDVQWCEALDTDGSQCNVSGDAVRGVVIQPGSLAQVKPNGTGKLPLTFLTASNAPKGSSNLRYQVKARICYQKDTQGVCQTWSGLQTVGFVDINYTVTGPGVASVQFKPKHIETGATKPSAGDGEGEVEGVPSTATFVVSNTGFAPLFNAQATLTMRENGNEIAAPAWATITAGAGNQLQLGTLLQGDSQDIGLHFAPDETVADGVYEFYVTVNSTDAGSTAVFRAPVYVGVSQSGSGNVRFHVSDLYTATLDAQNQLIKGLGDASITLKPDNALNSAESQLGTTNANGEVLFSDLPTGSYTYRISASGHESKTGTVYILPNMTQAVDEFLMNVLVTVDWEVKEITLEDRYEVKLTSTFVTNVPAPVVAIEPAYTNLPVMKKGDVQQGELKITNKGLMRADHFTVKFPQDSELVDFEFTGSIPTSLQPGQVVYVQYRALALRDFMSDVPGGPCGSYSARVDARYDSICAAGFTVNGSASSSFGSSWGTSCGAGGGGGGSYHFNPGGGGGSGGTTYRPKGSTDIGEFSCPPPPCDDDCK